MHGSVRVLRFSQLAAVKQIFLPIAGIGVTVTKAHFVRIADLGAPRGE